MFYSNCFLEAIKHKLKDWHHVKITYIPPQYNECFVPIFFGVMDKLTMISEWNVT